MTGRSVRTLQRLEGKDSSFPQRVVLPTRSFGFRPEEVKRWWETYATGSGDVFEAIGSCMLPGPVLIRRAAAPRSERAEAGA